MESGLVDIEENQPSVKRRVEFKLPRDILEAAQVTLQELESRIQIILDNLQREGTRLIGMDISGTSQIQYIFELSWILTQLRQVPGFDRWKKTYIKRQEEHAFLVGKLAALMKAELNDLELEPPTRNGHSCDFAGDLGQTRVFFECKCWDDKLEEYRNEHQRIARIIMKEVTTRHQISFTYKTPPTSGELNRLIRLMNDKIPSVTGSGDILLNDDYRVNVQWRDQLIGETRLSAAEFVLGGYSLDTYAQTTYPSHILMVPGRIVAVEGPLNAFENETKGLFKRSSRQAPDSAPFVLAIDAGNYQGSYKNLPKYISSEFQPRRNTRFSAVLVANAFSRDELLDFIPNPYAKWPIPATFTNALARMNKAEWERQFNWRRDLQ